MEDKIYTIINLHKGKLEIERYSDINKTFDRYEILTNKDKIHVILIEGFLLTQRQNF